MSATRFIVLRCDRCGNDTQVEDGRAPEGWGRVHAHTVGARASIGGDDNQDDLCPGCLSALLVFYRSVDGPVAPPPAPPPPARPIYTLDDRKRAIDAVVTQMRVRCEFELGVLRAAPTAILSGDMVPGLLFGIDDAAAEIVDGIIDQLGLKKRGRRK